MLRSSLIAFALLSVAGSASAGAPTLSPGTCTYLVGAPAGATAASEEETYDGALVTPTCLSTNQVAARRVNPNGVEIYLEPPLPPISLEPGCHAAAWAGHEFVVSGVSDRTMARIDLTGGLDGLVGYLRLNTAQGVGLELEVEAIVEAMDSLTGEYIVVAREELFGRNVPTGPQQIRERFARRLEMSVNSGGRYRVGIHAEAQSVSVLSILDFGAPGSGLGIWYDSIQVCIDPPDSSGATLLARLDALEERDLEARLHDRQCIPSIWMPAAQGGLLESARSLVRDRIDRAAATGDPNVNTRVAEARLASADASIANAQYQRACRELSDGLRALTTP